MRQAEKSKFVGNVAEVEEVEIDAYVTVIAENQNKEQVMMRSLSGSRAER